ILRPREGAGTANPTAWQKPHPRLQRVSPGRSSRSAGSGRILPMRRTGVCLLSPLLALAAVSGGTSSSRGALASLSGLELWNAQAEAVSYRGRSAVRLMEKGGNDQNAPAGGDAIALISGLDFQDGTIEIDLAGLPRPGATDGARGFVGLAFRVQ